MIIFVLDDPTSIAYQELRADYKRFQLAIILETFRGSKVAKYLLKRKERSCENRCNETRKEGHLCHCDMRCALFQDCCVDYWPR